MKEKIETLLRHYKRDFKNFDSNMRESKKDNKFDSAHTWRTRRDEKMEAIIDLQNLLEQ